MKNIKLIYAFSIALMLFAFSCNDDDFVVYGTETKQQIADPFLQIKTPVIAFQAGTPSYTMEFNVVNGLKKITSVEVYKIFTDATTGNQSNEALLASYPVGDGLTVITDDLTYADLKAGLTINGGPLPDSELDLPIGSGWVFRFIGRRDAGDLELPGTINVGVLSRFAGLYKVIEAAYYRIGVLTNGGPWVGETRFIGSVDATTFSHNDFWGPFAWGGHAFTFTLNEADNTIIVPVDGGIYSGNRALSCSTEPEQFTNVPCVGSDILIPDNVNGKHIIKLTYGYYTDGSGPREFYEVLEKI